MSDTSTDATDAPVADGVPVTLNGRSILAREHGHLEAICDALIASLAGRCEDDVTVILARIPASRAG